MTQGRFEVELHPQQDELHPAGRMLINKTYFGDLEGTGVGQMLSKRTENGASVYSAIEEFNGQLGGKRGGFTLVHNGYMSKDTHKLDVIILPGSGTDELEGITGTMEIIQSSDGHSYVLSYAL